MPSFPVADKITSYVIEGKRYTRIGQREAVNNPAAIRAMFVDKLQWFEPEKTVGDLLKESEAEKKPKLAS